MEKVNFTSDELYAAKNVSMKKVVEDCGFTYTRVGCLGSVKEMDSIRIYNDKDWVRFSKKGNINGGSTIDFVMEFLNKNIVEAVEYLLNLDGVDIKKVNILNDKNSNSKNSINETIKREFNLPEKSKTGYKRLYAYLINKREIDKYVVDYFVNNDLCFETEYKHNICFCGYNKYNEIKYAALHGTYDLNGKTYKGDVSGNDKKYGVNIKVKNSNTINVFEACIDMMSYCCLTGDLSKTNKIALGMLSDHPLETFLKENNQIENINFYLDMDEPGRKAAHDLELKYTALGYNVKNNTLEYGKDVNDYLKYVNHENQRNRGLKL